MGQRGNPVNINISYFLALCTWNFMIAKCPFGNSFENKGEAKIMVVRSKI